MWDCSICRKILVEVGDDVALDAHVFHVHGNTAGGDGINAGGVIHKIGGKGALLNFTLGKVARQLVEDGCHHFKVGELLRAYLTSVIVYDIIGVQPIKRRITYGNHQRVQRYY